MQIKDLGGFYGGHVIALDMHSLRDSTVATVVGGFFFFFACSSRLLHSRSKLTKNINPRQTRVLFTVEFLTAITTAVQGCLDLLPVKKL